MSLLAIALEKMPFPQNDVPSTPSSRKDALPNPMLEGILLHHQDEHTSRLGLNKEMMSKQT